MSGRACVLAVLMVLGGCASMPGAITDVPETTSLLQADASAVAGAEDESMAPEDATPPRTSRAPKRRSAPSRAGAASAAAVKVESSALPTTDEPNPDRAVAARRMDEQSQRWNSSAKQALRSICAGC